MKMVLSQIASNVELCKVAQQHPLFPRSAACELLHDPLTKDERVCSACSAHSALPHTPLPQDEMHKLLYFDLRVIGLVFMCSAGLQLFISCEFASKVFRKEF